MNQTLALLLLMSWTPPTPIVNDASAVPSVDVLAEYLDRLERQIHCIDTTVISWNLGFLEQNDEENWPEFPVDIDDLTQYIVWRWVRCDARLRMTKAGNGSMNESDPSLVNVWDGSSWYMRNSEIRPGQHDDDVKGLYFVMPAVDSPLELYDCLALFNGGGDWPSFASHLSLAASVRASRLLSTNRDGDMASLVFSQNDEDSRLIRIQLTMHDDESFQLFSITTDSLGGPQSEFAGQVMIRKSLVIDAWAQYEGIRLPSEARRLGVVLRHPSRVGKTPQAYCIIMKRRIATFDEADDSLFLPPIAEQGDLVLDQRMGISYVVGRSRIAIEKEICELKDPIAGLIQPAAFLELKGQFKGKSEIDDPGDDR
ncbi:MAG: hypothetical protein O7G85_10040 [Planctomycetota bacterium]|nr:hypothetical protein [Planctomycetota bacterium]